MAYKKLDQNEMYSHFFKPTKAIEFAAIAVHKVTYKAAIERAESYYSISKILPIDVAIGHNVRFDLNVLGIDCPFIDTKALARFLFPQWEGHNLTTCMFYIHDTEEEALSSISCAHEATADVLNTEKLYRYIAKYLGIDYLDIDSMLIESNKAVQFLEKIRL